MSSKLLIIDKNLNDLNIFVNAIADDVLHIIHDQSSNISDLYDIISGIGCTLTVGFVYHSHGFANIPFYHDKITDPIDMNEIDSGSTAHVSRYVFSQKLIKFIKDFSCGNTGNSLTIDLITCDAGKIDYSTVAEELQVQIRYSDNLDASKSNWVLNVPYEVSIKNFYFNNTLINLWNHTLLASTDIGENIRNGTDIYLSHYIKYDKCKKTFKVLKDFNWPYVLINSSSPDYYIGLNDNEIFDGNNGTITFGNNGTGYNIGIFASLSTYGSTRLPLIKDLTIKSFINGEIINDYAGGFMRNGQNNFIIKNCHHKGQIANGGGITANPLSLNIQSDYTIKIISCSQKGDMTDPQNIGGNGGIISGGFANNLNVNSSINVLIKDCTYRGSSIGNNAGGICGSDILYGCFGNNNRNNQSILNVEIINCKNYGSFNGNNCAGILAGCDGNFNMGGCFGNRSRCTFNVSVIKCKNYGSLSGQNCAGILAGGDNNGTGGGGCFGNSSTGIFNILFKKCSNHRILIGNNTAGILAGGNNNNTGGSGCFGNSSLSTFNVTFKKCYNTADIYGANSAGLLAGGDNYSGEGGGGCFGNSSGRLFNVLIEKCYNNGSLTGKNSGGLLAGGDNYEDGVGAGCFGNFSNGTFNVTIRTFSNIANINGANSAGLLAGGDNTTGTSSGAGCFGNTSSATFNVLIEKCYNKGTFTYKNSGGLLAGGDNVIEGSQGAGCFNNNSQNSCVIIFKECTLKSDIIGINNGGLLAGGNLGCFANNNGTNSELNLIIEKCSVEGKIIGNGSGGLCASGIGQNPNGIILSINISECKVNAKEIGLSNGSVVSAGLLGGNVYINSAGESLIIENCYVNGTVESGSAGFIGGTVDPSSGTNIIIRNSYFSKHYSNTSFPIIDPVQCAVIYNCYYGDSLYKIKGRLSDLPKKYWKKTRKYPELKYFD